tara:strand:+ start:1302 stop:1427 length:126 start_codon:yes stop_codon:yes gene_type:complete
MPSAYLIQHFDAVEYPDGICAVVDGAVGPADAGAALVDYVY